MSYDRIKAHQPVLRVLALDVKVVSRYLMTELKHPSRFEGTLVEYISKASQNPKMKIIVHGSQLLENIQKVVK